MRSCWPERCLVTALVAFGLGATAASAMAETSDGRPSSPAVLRSAGSSPAVFGRLAHAPPVGGSPAATPAATSSEAPCECTETEPPEPQISTGDVESYAGYDASYIFGLTRSVARSTMATAAKPPLFVLTIPLDIVLLPFAAIGGLFS